ncbi:MAG: glycosyltransferase family 39 protein, partial [Nitrospinota bacterium]
MQFFVELKNYHFIGVLSFLTLLLAFNQPWVISGDGDSIVYATISKTITEKGNWLTPVYNFRNFFDHPPLLFWVNALLFKIFGFEEWVPKLFTGISGLGAVLLVFYIGNRYANPYTGFFAGLSMLLSYDFIKLLNKSRMDIPLVFFYICALYYFLKGIEGGIKWFYLSGIFIGLAFLTKGIVSAGIFIISLILIFDLKKVSLLKRKEVWLFVLISLSIPGIFFLAQYHVTGEFFFKRYFSEQVYQSIREGVN